MWFIRITSSTLLQLTCGGASSTGLRSKGLDLQQPQHSAILKNAIRETLRLYPVAPFVTRYLPADSTICGYDVPKGTLVILSLYTVGRNPAYFDDPCEFNPRRWSRDDRRRHQQSAVASLPFAMGARSCIGRKIAEAQLQAALAHLVRRFRVREAEEGRGEVEMVLRMVAVPAEPVRLRFEEVVA